MLKAAIKLTFLIAFGISGYSQKGDESINNSRLKNYWGFSLTPLLLAKADIDGDKDKYQLHSLPQFGAEVLINFYYNFEQNYSLVFGAGGNLSAYNFNYYISKEMFNPPIGFDLSSNKAVSRESGIFNFRLQAEMQRRWPRDEAKNWDLAAGLSLLYSGAIPGDISEVVLDSSGQYKEFLTRTNQYNNNGKPWFNFHISGGHEWILRSGNIFQVNLKLNFSTTDFATGTYLFSTGIQPDLSGKYGLSGSYIGLSLAYIFARTKLNNFFSLINSIANIRIQLPRSDKIKG
jgi:hypothetical protein